MSLSHAALPDVSEDQHHDKLHAHDGADGSGTVAHPDTTGQTANDHHNQQHAIDGPDHTGSLDADEIVFAPIGGISAIDVQAAIEELDAEKSDVGHGHAHSATTGQTPDDHHNEDHATRHEVGGADAVAVTHAQTTGKTANDHHDQAHAIDGADHTGTLAHSATSGQTANDHHDEDHAARHSDGGADEVIVENLATASLDVSRALRPNGTGGLAFLDIAHADTTGIGIDDHHARDHFARHLPGGADALYRAVRKSADETVNNQSFLLADDELRVASIGANQAWVFQFMLFIDQASATPNFKYDFLATNSAAFSGWHQVTSPSRDPGSGAHRERLGRLALTTAQGVATSASTFIQIIDGIVIMGNTAADLLLRWAQNTATAADTTVLTDSNAIAWRLE